jgi:hypothetical protein
VEKETSVGWIHLCTLDRRFVVKSHRPSQGGGEGAYGCVPCTHFSTFDSLKDLVHHITLDHSKEKYKTDPVISRKNFYWY